MAVHDLYSKRQKKLRGETPEVFTYDEIPDALRVRFVHIIRDAFGNDEHTQYSNECDKMYQTISDILCREYGLFTLNNRSRESYEEQTLNFILQTTDTEKVIDAVELCFKYIDRIIRPDFEHFAYYTKPKLKPDEAILELNERFKEEGIGFSFEGGEIIRVDSTYIHSEITKPTLALLWNDVFNGANEEYLLAHEHYRHGRNKECLAECLKAFESTLKIICSEKGWEYDNERDTSSKLIAICLEKELIPAYTQNQFSCLRSLLESGIPTIRNRLGGHGQGQAPKTVDDKMVRYALNLTGTNIIFLIEQSGITKSA